MVLSTWNLFPLLLHCFLCFKLQFINDKRYHSKTPHMADMPGHDIITLFIFSCL